jgi:hypothetical protein
VTEHLQATKSLLAGSDVPVVCWLHEAKKQYRGTWGDNMPLGHEATVGGDTEQLGAVRDRNKVTGHHEISTLLIRHN